MSRLYKFMAAIIAVLPLLLTVSCTKQDKSADIVGNWQSTRFNYQTFNEDGKLIGESTENCIGWYTGFSFSEDGSGLVISYEDGSTETIRITWTVMGEQLILTSDYSASQVFDINSITNSDMVLSSEYTYNDGSYEITTIHFKRS